MNRACPKEMNYVHTKNYSTNNTIVFHCLPVKWYADANAQKYICGRHKNTHTHFIDVRNYANIENEIENDDPIYPLQIQHTACAHSLRTRIEASAHIATAFRSSLTGDSDVCSNNTIDT